MLFTEICERLSIRKSRSLSDPEIQEVFCTLHNLNYNDIDNKTKKDLERKLKKHIEEDQHPTMPHVRKFQGVSRFRRQGYPCRAGHGRLDREIWDNLVWVPSAELNPHVHELRAKHYHNDTRPPLPSPPT